MDILTAPGTLVPPPRGCWEGAVSATEPHGPLRDFSHCLIQVSGTPACHQTHIPQSVPHLEKGVDTRTCLIGLLEMYEQCLAAGHCKRSVNASSLFSQPHPQQALCVHTRDGDRSLNHSGCEFMAWEEWKGPERGSLQTRPCYCWDLDFQPPGERRDFCMKHSFTGLCTTAQTSMPMSRAGASVHRRVTQSSSHSCFSDA